MHKIRVRLTLSGAYCHRHSRNLMDDEIYDGKGKISNSPVGHPCKTCNKKCYSKNKICRKCKPKDYNNLSRFYNARKKYRAKLREKIL